MDNYDFSGWATKANVKCADGRVIMPNAFKHNDGQTVPLVWNHQHNDPNEVLGHALLENRDDGVYAYCTFNDTESGKTAKLLVQHGDIVSLSIYANQLKQNLANVVHGNIRELSLVLAGANPEASIQSVIMHGEESEEEAVIFNQETLELYHAANENGEGAKEEKKVAETEKEPESKETIGDIFNTLSEKQKTMVYAMIGQALEDGGASDDEVEHSDTDNNNEEDNTMKHNVFDKETQQENTLSHSDMEAILADAKRGAGGSLRDAFLAHTVTDAGGNNVTYGIANIDYLFPDARTTQNVPDFIKRDMDWVTKVMNGAKHLPFSRVKSVYANITMDEARAKGYVKGHQKTEEVFSLLKRTTSPTTIYKKQKLDRDDVIDITDFNVVAWLKGEMRLMLNEEIARAALISDGRVAGTDDKISEDCIRPIWKDAETYVVRKAVTPAAGATDEDNAKEFIKQAIKGRKDYKGSGNPALYTTEDVLTDCLLIEDGNGRVIYDSVEKLKTTLRVSDIVTVPVMEDLTRTGTGADAAYTFTLMGIFVNMADYSFGADKGGSVNLFDDFDIDYNQMKYLIETRCSGALTKYHSALVIEKKTTT